MPVVPRHLFCSSIFVPNMGFFRRFPEAERYEVVGKSRRARGTIFLGRRRWVTDAGVLADSTEPSSAGQLWRVHVPGGGPKAHLGYINLP
jgi:hypothetical protein